MSCMGRWITDGPTSHLAQYEVFLDLFHHSNSGQWSPGSGSLMTRHLTRPFIWYSSVKCQHPIEQPGVWLMRLFKDLEGTCCYGSNGRTPSISVGGLADRTDRHDASRECRSRTGRVSLLMGRATRPAEERRERSARQHICQIWVGLPICRMLAIATQAESLTEGDE